MKHFLSVIAALVMSIFATFADTVNQPKQPVDKGDPRPIVLTRERQKASDRHRAPAMPMYGNFDGETLTVDIRGAEDNEILTVYFHCANSVEQQNCTAAELRQGITVTVDSHFWLEIVTESGVVYKEYNETQED